MEKKPIYGSGIQEPFAKVKEAKDKLISEINALSSWTGDTPHAQQFDEQLNIAKKQIIDFVNYTENGLDLYLEAEFKYRENNN